MPPVNELTDAEKYARCKELNRQRQQRYYNAHKEKLLQARKEIREKIRDDNKVENNPVELESNKAILNKLENGEGNKSSNLKYVNDLKTVLGITDCEHLAQCLKEPKKIIEMIDTSIQKRSGKDYSINSKKGFIQAVLVAITKANIKLPKKTLDMYKAYFDKLKLLSTDQTKGKKDNMGIDNFNTYLEKVKDKFGEISKEYVLASLYHEATLRDDFGKLAIIRSMKEVNDGVGNYIIIPSRGSIRILIQSYKTQTKYGVIDEKLSDKLSKLIRAYVKENNIVTYLFGLNAKGLTDFVSKMNKSLGLKTDGAISNFRHMKIAMVLDNASVDERIALAAKMKHSPFIQETYLRKLI